MESRKVTLCLHYKLKTHTDVARGSTRGKIHPSGARISSKIRSLCGFNMHTSCCTHYAYKNILEYIISRRNNSNFGRGSLNPFPNPMFTRLHISGYKFNYMEDVNIVFGKFNLWRCHKVGRVGSLTGHRSEIYEVVSGHRKWTGGHL